MGSGCDVRSGKKDEAGTRETGMAAWGQKGEGKTPSKGAADEKGCRERRQSSAGFQHGLPCNVGCNLLSQLGFGREKGFCRYFGQEGNLYRIPVP